MPSALRSGWPLALLAAWLPALAPALAPARAQDAAEDVAARPLAGYADALLGGPLLVDGERVPEVDLKRHLIHAVGSGVLRRVWMRWMVEAELTERAHRHAFHTTGQDETFERTYSELLVALEVAEDELDDEVDYQRSFLHWRNAGLDPDTAIRQDHGTLAEFKEHVRATMLFDRVFLPDDPDEWPRVTVEAFLADPGGGQILVDDARESYLTRLQLGEEYGGEPPRDDESLRRTYRDIVRRSLTSWLDIRTAVDGLAPPLVATVDFDADGEPEERIEVDDLWPAVRPLVDQEDVRLARHWLATVAATRSRLLESGYGPEAELRKLARPALRSRDDARSPAVWEGEFPSAEVYFDYAWLREGVRRRFGRDLANLGTFVTVAPGATAATRSTAVPGTALRARESLPARREIVPDSLADAVWRVRAVAGGAKVEAEFLLTAAWDEETSTWNDDGWACARERADGVAESLMHLVDIHTLQVRRFKQVTVPAPGVLWSKALDAHSEFWEPSPSRTPRSTPPLSKGRFGTREFEELRAMLRVTHYSRFALGGSLADDVMFHLPVDRIVGPRRGPLGYYLVRVLGRTGPESSIDPGGWVDAVLDEATLDYAREAVEQAETLGLD